MAEPAFGGREFHFSRINEIALSGFAGSNRCGDAGGNFTEIIISSKNPAFTPHMEQKAGILGDSAYTAFSRGALSVISRSAVSKCAR